MPSAVTAAELAALCRTAPNHPLTAKSTGRAMDEAFEADGYVQLRKSAKGAPAWWIAPDYLEAAVSVSTNEQAGQLGAARLANAGLSQKSGRWTAVRRRRFSLCSYEFETVQHDECTVQTVLALWGGEHAELPSAGEDEHTAVRACLLEHIQNAQQAHPAYASSLRPLLQQALQPGSTADGIRKAAKKAYAQWRAYAAELETYAELSRSLAFDRYPHSFHVARSMRREVELFIGPPNSGKTHAAFEELARARSGTYLAPLRLLALEGRDRLSQRGVVCSLLTGEERDEPDGATVTSSTVEMLNTQRAVDVAVIDEAQMLFDPSRGWAWTQALVGAPASRVIIICSAYAASAVQAVLAACGEKARVREFTRKQHLQLLRTPVALKQVETGDALVAFSRRDVLQLRDKAEADGKRVALIYGALPPEVRRREAERFASGEADILVATDAIGMGLNLPIRRVLFSTLQKYDGIGDRPLEVTEVHQIAGRAGRFGIHEEGFAGVLATAERPALRALGTALQAHPAAPVPFKARVAPNSWHVAEIADQLGHHKLRPVLAAFVQSLSLESDTFVVASLDQMMELAQQLDMFAPNLPLKDRFTYAQAPVDVKGTQQVEHFLSWTRAHAKTGKAGPPHFARAVDEFSRLDEMEQALRLCTLWLWLDLRFPGCYGHLSEILYLREELNRGIERRLRSSKPLAATR